MEIVLTIGQIRLYKVAFDVQFVLFLITFF